MTIGDLEELREKFGLNSTELASLLGVSRAAYVQWVSRDKKSSRVSSKLREEYVGAAEWLAELHRNAVAAELSETHFRALRRVLVNVTGAFEYAIVSVSLGRVSSVPRDKGTISLPVGGGVQRFLQVLRSSGFLVRAIPYLSFPTYFIAPNEQRPVPSMKALLADDNCYSCPACLLPLGNPAPQCNHCFTPLESWLGDLKS